MASYHEALPIYKVAMDVAVRVDAVVRSFAKGHKRRRLAYLFERRAVRESEQEKAK
jgi:hypothetical protein